ncbi:MAG: hypothetical protein M1429_03650 [Patescibacteria group bacterium]|nr:hypothetical protein [Patescibacteria group bacterium]
MKRTLVSLVVVLLIVPVSIFSEVKLAHAAYSAGNIMPDVEFVNSTVLDAAGVQSFLNTKGGTRLRAFSEGGRSAAQIIADAARSNGISPYVILATIQKEESLVESNYNFDYRVNWAMGYAVCDSCSLDDPDVVKYKGFTKQVDNGAWQLKHNYGLAGSDATWGVGRTMIIDDTSVRFATRATSALYRYTPHLSGNENFYNIYYRYKAFHYVSKATKTKTAVSKSTSAKNKLGATGSKGGSQSGNDYDAQYVTQTGASSLRSGQKLTIYVYMKNTGSATWKNTGSNPVYLGNSGPRDRNSVFTGGNGRWHMLSSSVLPGRIGVFSMQITAPAAGTYQEKFQPVMEGVTWFGSEVAFNFTVR